MEIGGSRKEYGPLKLRSRVGGNVPGVAGYRVFVHSAMAAGCNDATTGCRSVFWYGYSEGVATCIAYVPLVPFAVGTNAVSFVCDVLLDEGYGLYYATDGNPVDHHGMITWCYVKAGEEYMCLGS